MSAYSRDPKTGAITPIPLQDYRGTTMLAKAQVGPFVISTIFLGLDHCGGLFETMVFCDGGDDFEEEQFRYETEDDAMDNHVVLVNKYGRLWRHQGKAVIDLRKI
jgi:hypothetical protein